MYIECRNEVFIEVSWLEFGRVPLAGGALVEVEGLWVWIWVSSDVLGFSGVGSLVSLCADANLVVLKLQVWFDNKAIVWVEAFLGCWLID